jgi:hypothetical protein
MCHIPDEFRNGASVVKCGGSVNENGTTGAIVRKGSGAAGGYIQVPKIGYEECRRWVGERAWQSAESGEKERVPRMGRYGQKQREMVRGMAMLLPRTAVERTWVRSCAGMWIGGLAGCLFFATPLGMAYRGLRPDSLPVAA